MALPTLRSSRPVTFPKRSSAISPTRRGSSAGKPASGPAGGGLLAMLALFALLFGLFVVMPLILLAGGAAPEAVLGWMGMIAAALAITWWLEGRRQAAELRNLPKPRQPTSPCAEKFQRRYGLAAETCAEPEKTPPRTAWTRFSNASNAEAAPASPAEPVPAFVVNELPGADGVYDARIYTVTDAFADTMVECDRLGLTGEDQVEALAAVIRGAKPSKTAAGHSRVSGGREPRLGRGGDGWARLGRR